LTSTGNSHKVIDVSVSKYLIVGRMGYKDVNHGHIFADVLVFWGLPLKLVIFFNLL